MTLTDYLAKRGLSYRAFAAESGISLATLHRIATGRNSTWPNLERIIKATGGKVKFGDLQPRPCAEMGRDGGEEVTTAAAASPRRQ